MRTNPACLRKTFAEQFPEIAPAYARRTLRQGKSLGEIGFALGGRAGARLARLLGLPVSFWTLLRLLRRTLPPAFDTPRVLGTDDFAWRKGEHYGTIVPFPNNGLDRNDAACSTPICLTRVSDGTLDARTPPR